MICDLAAWLRAQLDADEQTARLALDVTERYAPDEPVITEWAWVRFTAPLTHPGNRSSMFFDSAHDPAFTLADIAAKKEIIKRHRVIPSAYPDAVFGNRPCCEVCSAAGEYPVTGEFPCATLRLLAQPYAGRPGWHNEWTTT